MIEAEKQRLRERMRKLALEGTPGNASLFFERLRELDPWKNSTSILLYSSIGSEPDPSSLMMAATGRSFLFPRIEGDHLEIYRMTSESSWIVGPFGIREPNPESWESASPKEIDLALVPGLAFDPAGGRLGRGKGFYDRLLGHPEFQGIKVGLAWDWQLLPSIPCEEHDIRMDFVIAEKMIHQGSPLISPQEGSMLDKPKERE